MLHGKKFQRMLKNAAWTSPAFPGLDTLTICFAINSMCQNPDCIMTGAQWRN